MPPIRTLAHIRTARMLNSFRTCVNITGQSQKLADIGRVYLAECHRLDRLKHDKVKPYFSQE
jgi:hypothetical protein